MGKGGDDLSQAVRDTLKQVKGTYAMAVVSEKRPNEIVAAKNASPLVLGYGNGETFLASDVPAILEHTREVFYLEDGELAHLGPEGIRIENALGETVTRAPHHVEWSSVAAEKDGYKHFMLKEIFEQPRVVADTIAGPHLARAGRRHARRARALRGVRAGPAPRLPSSPAARAGTPASAAST